MTIFGGPDPKTQLLAATLDAPPLYRQHDWLGAVLAYVSLAPAFHLFYRGSLLYAHRSITQLEHFLGAFTNAVISKALKQLIKQQRPAATCEQLGLCDEMGMPSNHSQIMAFAYVTMLLLLPALRKRQQQHWLLDSLELVWYTAATAGVAWSRMYLGYHDLQQVSAGLLLGAVYAVIWARIVDSGILRQLMCRLAAVVGIRLQPHEHSE